MMNPKLNVAARPTPAARPVVRTSALSLKPLPYAPDALEPHMSKATFEVRGGPGLQDNVQAIGNQLPASHHGCIRKSRESTPHASLPRSGVVDGLSGWMHTGGARPPVQHLRVRSL